MKQERRFDVWYLVTIGALLLTGLFTLASATGPLGFQKFGDSYWFVRHQMLSGLLPGLFGFLFFWKFPASVLKRSYAVFYAISIALLLVVFLPGLGNTYGTARSWINIAGMSFQTSELVKLTLLIALAGWLDATGRVAVTDVKRGFGTFLLALLVPLGLMVLQPDVGGMTVIAFEMFVVYFVAGGSLLYMSGLAGFGLMALYALMTWKSYRSDRFMVFLHPELDPQGAGYHINQALLTIGSGGIFGLGFGHSRQKYQYLPEVPGDSIFAVFAEELGLLFALLLIAGFLFLLYRCIRIGEKSPDAFGKYVAIGFATWVVWQAFVNITSMLGLLPLTGLTLPFLSYGGSSLFVLLCAAGLVLQISGADRR